MADFQVADQQLKFRSLLRREFRERQARNPSYSLRSFAKALDIDSSSLSKIMTGRRDASSAIINSVARVLKLDLGSIGKVYREQEFSSLSEKQFSIIADWQHFAILDLVQLRTFKPDLDWMAKQLSIEKALVKNSVDRLLACGLLKAENGTLIKTSAQFTNDLGLRSSVAQKEYQRQVVQLGLSAIDDCESFKKEICSITIAANPAKLELAREKIKQFRRDMCALMEDGQSEEVYHLAIQLYPVTNRQSEMPQESLRKVENEN